MRWEEFGKPEETTAEWQASEYKNAVLDLKLDLLSGMTLNIFDVDTASNRWTENDDELPYHGRRAGETDEIGRVHESREGWEDGLGEVRESVR